MLEKWNKEPVITGDDNLVYAGELWLSLTEYEKKVAAEIKGHDMILN